MYSRSPSVTWYPIPVHTNEPKLDKVFLYNCIAIKCLIINKNFKNLGICQRLSKVYKNVKNIEK